MTRLFLDCEWADNIGSELVSLALVSEDGLHRFYAEMVPLPSLPTSFVKYVIYSLLEHGQVARDPVGMTRDLRVFLSGVPQPNVIYDDAVDGALFRYALDGFELEDAMLAQLPPTPALETTLLADRDAVRRQIDRYFAGRPEQAKRRHHALVDAEALRWAFRELIDEVHASDVAQPTRCAKSLADTVPIRGGGTYVLERDIPEADRTAFWAFTQHQAVFATESGLAIPSSAWSEYLAWLSEPGADPSAVSSATKHEWRLRTGRWT